jgi:CRISPR type I-E-associated protein CasB/Cse2
MSQVKEKINKGKAFIARLAKLSAGDLAILRRCNQNPLEDQRLFSTLGKVGALNIYEYALVACMYAVYHKADDIPRSIEGYNFGKAFRHAYDPDNKKQDTRFRAVLSAGKGDALAYRLRQAIRLIKSKEEAMDFAVLLSDLYNWEKQDKWIQRKWAQGYYEGFLDSTDLPEDNDTEIDSEENDNDDE